MMMMKMKVIIHHIMIIIMIVLYIVYVQEKETYGFTNQLLRMVGGGIRFYINSGNFFLHMFRVLDGT